MIVTTNSKLSIKDGNEKWVAIKPLTLSKPIKYVEILLHKTTGELLVNMHRGMFFDMSWIITRAEWENIGGE